MSQMQAFKPVKQPASFWQQVGIPSRGVTLYESVHKGLDFDVFDKLAKHSRLEKKELATAVTIPPATLNRRSKAGRFNKDESDRLYRFAEIFNQTINLFEGDILAACEWIKSPVVGLGNRRPIDMVATIAESEGVLNLIGRLEHGVFS
ncbi:type II RES/Xre toxin-antitoxin system antitoxin [Vibrio crassostreae]|uniref:type II RES/Xre toxin-antitoxin system antitoxin n=1 Tax=Vibrio crassostreae TaxID=246167 RepID=UPI0040684A8C